MHCWAKLTLILLINRALFFASHFISAKVRSFESLNKQQSIDDETILQKSTPAYNHPSKRTKLTNSWYCTVFELKFEEVFVFYFFLNHAENQ